MSFQMKQDEKNKDGKINEFYRNLQGARIFTKFHNKPAEATLTQGLSPTVMVDPARLVTLLPAFSPQLSGKKLINVTYSLPYTCQLAVDGEHARARPFSADDSGAVPFSMLPGSFGNNRHSIIKNKRWHLSVKNGYNALFHGIRALNDAWKSIHIGWTGPIKDLHTKVLIKTADIVQSDYDDLLMALTDNGNYVPVFLDDESSKNHYEGYCKQILWPVFHSMLWTEHSNVQMERQYWADYIKVNQAFVDAILERYETGDIVWIHDHHLLLVPQMLRKIVPDVSVGLFVHAPFPTSEIFRALPRESRQVFKDSTLLLPHYQDRKQILEGMLGANQIGFQTYADARHFISACTRVLGLESNPIGVDTQSHMVAIGAFPIGIDVAKVEGFLREPGVAPKIEAIKKRYEGKRLVVGRDTLDVSKGVLQKLKAFEAFLELFPERREQVVLVQVTTPALRENQRLERKVTELVASINNRYGTLEFRPIHHFHQHIDRDEYYALLSAGDVGLITSIRDGMNTTSMEFVVAQQETFGALILSEFTGTAGSLAAAVMVNPWDYMNVAKGINECLLMSFEERLERHRQLINHVRTYDARNWAQMFVKQLTATTALQESTLGCPELSVERLLEFYDKSTQRLIFLDYDGTLTPIVNDPQAALPPTDALKYLTTLCANPRNVVWIISGRDKDFLTTYLGHIPNLGFSAEHGCFMRHPGSTDWINLTESMDMTWQHDVAKIFDYYTERTQGSFVEYKRSSITWHYRMADPIYGVFQAKECHNHLENAILSKYPIDILLGKKNIEVRPNAVNKGEIVHRLVQAHPSSDFILCAGDDKTDEDMFRTLKKANPRGDNYFAISVGESDKKTCANYVLRDSHEVVKALGTLAGYLKIDEGVEAY